MISLEDGDDAFVAAGRPVDKRPAFAGDGRGGMVAAFLQCAAGDDVFVRGVIHQLRENGGADEGCSRPYSAMSASISPWSR